MAGDWLKIAEDLHEKPEVLKMATMLKTRPEHVAGYCLRFWGWVSRNCGDGVIRGVSLDAVEGVLGLPHFLGMMRNVGWLEYLEETDGPVIIIPKFERHLSGSAKQRANAAEKKRNQRQNVSTQKGDTCPDSVPAKQGPEKRRVEKRREENKKPPKSPKGDFDFSTLELPFQSSSFEASWADFVQMRREIRKPLRETGAKASLKKLAAMGEARAVAALEHTTANEWQGIREPEAPRNNGQPKVSALEEMKRKVAEKARNEST